AASEVPELAASPLDDVGDAAATAVMPTSASATAPPVTATQRGPRARDASFWLQRIADSATKPAASSIAVVSRPTTSGSSRPVMRYHAYTATVPSSIAALTAAQCRRRMTVQAIATANPMVSTMKSNATLWSSDQWVGTSAMWTIAPMSRP